MNNQKITPIGVRVIVQPIEVEAKSAGGLILATVEKQSPTQGKVFSIGNKVEEVKNGDLVVFNQFSGVPIDVDGETLLLMNESDITMIILPSDEG